MNLTRFALRNARSIATNTTATGHSTKAGTRQRSEASTMIRIALISMVPVTDTP